MPTVHDELEARLRRHVEALQADSRVDIDERLIQQCRQVLPTQSESAKTTDLISYLSATIPTISQNPTELNTLLTALLEPFSFSQILSLSKDIDFETGLSRKARPYNDLLLSILHKAAKTQAEAIIVVSRPQIFIALITLWLSTPDTRIAVFAGQVIYELLRIDHHGSSSLDGPKLVWKRVFNDSDVYSLFFTLCVDLPGSSSPHPLTQSERTIAQSRLLDLLPSICALDWSTISRSRLPDCEKDYVPAGEGLLSFGALHMVETSRDVLMHKCLYAFYARLIEVVRSSGSNTTRDSSLALDYLIQHEIHQRIIHLFIDPDSAGIDRIECAFMYPSAATYLATYAKIYSDHFLNSPTMPNILGALFSAEYSAATFDRVDSHIVVLTSIPRTALIERQAPHHRILEAYNRIPMHPAKLDGLAQLFRGPQSIESITYPETSPLTSSIDERGVAEGQAAFVIYYFYVNLVAQDLFKTLVKLADTVAVLDLALAAIGVIKSVITSNWSPLSASPVRGMITEVDLVRALPKPTPPYPSTGAQAMLAPPALEHVLPWLIGPAKTFAGSLGGRGDIEGAAYKVAVAKYDCLKALHDKLQIIAESDPEPGYDQIISSLRNRLSRGPLEWVSAAGSNVATMEM